MSPASEQGGSTTTSCSFQWTPGLKCPLTGEAIMPCGLTASEIEALSYDERHELAGGLLLPPPLRYSAARWPTEWRASEPATPVNKEADAPLSGWIDQHPTTRDGLAAPNSELAFHAAPAGNASFPVISTHWVLNSNSPFAPADPADSSTEGSTGSTLGSTHSVFDSINRVAAVAGNEYIRKRSGRRKRSGEQREEAVGRQHSSRQLQSEAAAQHGEQLQQAAAAAAQGLPLSHLAKTVAAAAEGQFDSLAAWLPSLDAAAGVESDTTAQQPPLSYRSLAPAQPAAAAQPTAPAPSAVAIDVLLLPLEMQESYLASQFLISQPLPPQPDLTDSANGCHGKAPVPPPPTRSSDSRQPPAIDGLLPAQQPALLPPTSCQKQTCPRKQPPSSNNAQVSQRGYPCRWCGIAALSRMFGYRGNRRSCRAPT